MLTVIYKRAGCEDMRFFRDDEEYYDWLLRQLKICPDTKIINIKEEKG